MSPKIKRLKKAKKMFCLFLLLAIANPTTIFCCSCAKIKMFDVLKFDQKNSKQLSNLNLQDGKAIILQYLEHLNNDKQIFIDEWQNTLQYHVKLAKNTYKYENFTIGINNFSIDKNANSVSFVLNVKCQLTSLNNTDAITTTIDGKYYFNNVKFDIEKNVNNSFKKLTISLHEYDWEINVSEYIIKVTKSNTKSIHTNTCRFKIENAEKIENFIEFFTLISCHNEGQKLITKNEKGHYLLNLESYYLSKQVINTDKQN